MNRLNITTGVNYFMVNSKCYCAEKLHHVLVAHLEMIHNNFLVLKKLDIIGTTNQTVENQSSPSEFAPGNSCARALIHSVIAWCQTGKISKHFMMFPSNYIAPLSFRCFCDMQLFNFKFPILKSNPFTPTSSGI